MDSNTEINERELMFDELLAALKELVANQEEGWRQTGTMPEDHIQSMPYLRRARAAIANAQKSRVAVPANKQVDGAGDDLPSESTSIRKPLK